MSRRRKSYAPRVVMCHDKNCLILHEWHQGASSEMSWSEIYEHWNQVQQQSIIHCMFFWCRFTVPNNTNANKAHQLPKCIFSPDTWKPHSWRRHVFKFKESQAEICLFFFVRSQMLVGNRTIGNLAIWACSIKYDTSELGRSKRHVECLPNLDCHFSWQWNAKKSNHKGLKWSQLQRSQHKQGNSFKLILHPSS